MVMFRIDHDVVGLKKMMQKLIRTTKAWPRKTARHVHCILSSLVPIDIPQRVSQSTRTEYVYYRLETSIKQQIVKGKLVKES